MLDKLAVVLATTTTTTGTTIAGSGTYASNVVILYINNVLR
jgi:hypothetical protein